MNQWIPFVPKSLEATCRRSPERAAWLARLPDSLRELQRRWSLTLGIPFDGDEVSCAWGFAGLVGLDDERVRLWTCRGRAPRRLDAGLDDGSRARNCALIGPDAQSLPSCTGRHLRRSAWDNLKRRCEPRR